MKKLGFLFIIFIFKFNILAQTFVCGTTSTATSASIPTTGTLKVLVIFAQFRDDTVPNNEGGDWPLNSLPTYANDFVSPDGTGPFAYDNLSQYYFEMSNGLFIIEGDVCDSLIVTDNDHSTYSSIAEVNREIVEKADPFVDYSDYDNYNGSSYGTDGIADFIYIIYRNDPDTLMYYTGIAHLELSSTYVTDDSVSIINHSFGLGGGVQMKDLSSGYFNLYTAAHELGHYLFGGDHIKNAANLVLMSDQTPVWSGSKGMSAWEREELGWIGYTPISSDDDVWLSDYLTSDEVIQIPVSTNEYFLIENRQHLSSHDRAGDYGIYIYHLTKTTWPPTIDVQCADGNWNFVENTTSHTLTRTTQNVTGNDEMNYYHYNSVDRVTYRCVTPVYFENSAWGDNEDAFDLSFNNVYSPVSNPRSTNSASLDFTVEVVGQSGNDYHLNFYFTDPEEGTPSRPQNVSASYNASNVPVLTWAANGESDIAGYNIYRAETTGGEPTSYTYIDYVAAPATSWTDFEINYGYTNNKVFYKIEAVDNTSKISVKSFPCYVNYLSPNITSNITLGATTIVNSGATLTISPGITVTIENGASLVVNSYGTLTANGTAASPITFDFVSSNSSTQNGIKFTTNMSMGTINYCQIRNAYRGIYENSVSINITNTAISGCSTGIYLYSSNPQIYRCNIHNNFTGINLLYSSPLINENYIQNNDAGIYCSSSSHPKIGNRSPQTGNQISGNTYGIMVFYNALPIVGNSSYGGFNNIVNNTNLLNATGGLVYAQNNWWGSTSNFKINGAVIYSPFLPNAVGIAAPPLSKTVGDTYATSEEDVPMVDELNKAYELAASNNLTEARAICLNLVNNYPDYAVSYNALNLLKETYSENDLTSKKSTFKTVFKNKGKKDLYALAGLLLSDIDKDNKLNQIDEVIENYKGEDIVELALFDKLVYYAFVLQDNEKARAISNELDKQFPNSQGAIEGHKILGDEKYFGKVAEHQKNIEADKERPEEYELLGNYPNPFNPSTTIKYALKEDAAVKLTVYDITGKEVISYDIPSQAAGIRSLVWNGKDSNGSFVSSGVYLYKINIKSLKTTEKFNQTAKLMLLK